MIEEPVTADMESLVALTRCFVHGSSGYCSLGPRARGAADAVVANATEELTGLGPSSVPVLKTQFIRRYQTGVQTLATGGWLTSSQAAVLTLFADAL